MTESISPVPIEDLLSHRAWVHRVARSLVSDASGADDLEQETWVKAHTSPPRHGGALKAWLGTVLRRTASDMRRSNRRRRRREEAAARPEGLASTADLAAEAEALKRVVAAVLDLAEPYRATLLLRYLDDLGPAEVARRLGVPIETVRTRLKRGLEMLRERFDAEAGGNRRTWSLPLVPLAQRAGPQPAAPIGGVPILEAALGAVLVTLKSKGIIAVAAVLLAAVAVGVATDLKSDHTPREVAPSSQPPESATAVGLRGTSPPMMARAGPSVPGSDEKKTTADAEAAPAGTNTASIVIEVVDEHGRRVGEGTVTLSTAGLAGAKLLGMILKDMDRYRWYFEKYDLATSNPVEVKDVPREFLAGQVLAEAVVPPYAPTRSDPIVLEAGSNVRVRLEVVPGRRVEFDVSDASDGRPVANARVVSHTEISRRGIDAGSISTPEGTGWSTTSAEGRCVVGELGPGPHDIEVLAEGFRAGRLKGMALDAGPIRVHLEKSHDTGVLEVLVTDPDGAPVSGLGVELYTSVQHTPIVVSTDASGIARFLGVAPGLQVTRLDVAAWVHRSGEAHWLGGPRQVLMGWVDLPTGETRRIALGYPRGGGVIACEVVDAEGSPVPSVEVRLFGPGHRDGQKTDREGRALFRDLPVGSYQTIVKRGDGDEWFDAQPRALTEGATLEVRRVLGGRSVSGFVRAAAEGHPPVAGAHVFMTGGTFAGSSTGADGSFLIRDALPGHYRVKGSADGLADLWTEVDVPRESDAGAPDLLLPRGGRIRLRVLQADRALLDAARLRLVDSRGEAIDLRQDSTGADYRWTELLAPGRYVLEIARGDDDKTQRPIDVTNGEDSLVALPGR